MQLQVSRKCKLGTMNSQSSPAAAPKAEAAAAALRRVAVDELLGGKREIVLLHAGEEYRLRVTSNGKLILTK
jgi:hemin uptake protein HemP